MSQDEFHKEMMNRYNLQMQEFMGKDVEVEKINGKKVEGKLIAYNPIHLNVVLETNTGKIVVRNVSSVSTKTEKKKTTKKGSTKKRGKR